MNELSNNKIILALFTEYNKFGKVAMRKLYWKCVDEYKLGRDIQFEVLHAASKMIENIK